MPIKITEIEKLNSERTRGEWVARKSATNPRKGISNSYPIVDAEFANGTLRDVCKSIYSMDEDVNNAAFIAAAPTITEQYIKARKFLASPEFVRKAYKIPDYAGSEVMEYYTKSAQAVIDQLFAEVEGE